MVSHPLHLEAKAGRWRLFAARKSDEGFASFAKKVWERDNYTCQFCGFQAKEYQEVVNLDGNYHNNKLSNMVTACCLCAQCLFIESVGKADYGGGNLIYMPEVTQAELNGFCHVLFCAVSNATSYRGDAQTIYRNLKLRAKHVEEELGEGMTDPALVGQMLIDGQFEDKKAFSEKLLKDLRLLPSRSKFRQQIDAWAMSALQNMVGKEEDK